MKLFNAIQTVVFFAVLPFLIDQLSKYNGLSASIICGIGVVSYIFGFIMLVSNTYECATNHDVKG